MGWEVEREYYVNDAGRQMDILTLSVWLRYLEAISTGRTARNSPAGGYRGAYIRDLARELAREHDARLGRGLSAVPPAEDDDGLLDVLIAQARTALGERGYALVADAVLTGLLGGIRDDLARFGVVFDRWFSERELVSSGAVPRVLEVLRERGEAYERDGALWFNAAAHGDEKDRVLVRANGQSTYFASDVAYHLDKFERGFDRVIDVWGADHHGYVPRVKGAVRALGLDADAFDVVIVQLASLWRGKQRVPMSTRSGEFVTLRDLVDEVGADAARFFYVLRKSDQHLDFDLELAKSQSNENPVYYVQYAHARIASVLRRARESAVEGNGLDFGHVERLTERHELDLLKALSRYPEVIESAATACEPHQLAHYLRELATVFHSFYNAHTILSGDEDLKSARLTLAESDPPGGRGRARAARSRRAGGHVGRTEMARKHRQVRPPRGKGGFLRGLVLGLAVAVGVQLYHAGLPDWSDDSGDEGADPASRHETSKTNFDFYRFLPKTEVRIDDPEAPGEAPRPGRAGGVPPLDHDERTTTRQTGADGLRGPRVPRPGRLVPEEEGGGPAARLARPRRVRIQHPDEGHGQRDLASGDARPVPGPRGGGGGEGAAAHRPPGHGRANRADGELRWSG